MTLNEGIFVLGSEKYKDTADKLYRQIAILEVVNDQDITFKNKNILKLLGRLVSFYWKVSKCDLKICGVVNTNVLNNMKGLSRNITSGQYKFFVKDPNEPPSKQYCSIFDISVIQNFLRVKNNYLNQLTHDSPYLSLIKINPLGEDINIQFRDQLVELALFSILQVVYEPIFDRIDVSFERENKSSKDAQQKINELSFQKTCLIVISIEKSYKHVDKIIIKTILQQKFEEKNFVEFIMSNFNSKLFNDYQLIDLNEEKGQAKSSFLGGFASRLLFEIYLSKFDKKLLQKLDHYFRLLNRNILHNSKNKLEKLYLQESSDSKLAYSRIPVAKLELLEYVYIRTGPILQIYSNVDKNIQ